LSLIKSISGIRGTIGGTIGDNLTAHDIVSSAAGYGMWLLQQDKKPSIVIGRDARISGALVSDLHQCNRLRLINNTYCRNRRSS